MSLILTVKRVTALPAQPAASTLYIVKATQANLVELYFTSADGTEVRRVPNHQDILDIVNNTAITSVDWSIIKNGPMSSAMDIDQAVLDAHHHSNKSILDNVSEDAQQNLMYRGAYPRVPLEVCEW